MPVYFGKLIPDHWFKGSRRKANALNSKANLLIGTAAIAAGKVLGATDHYRMLPSRRVPYGKNPPPISQKQLGQGAERLNAMHPVEGEHVENYFTNTPWASNVNVYASGDDRITYMNRKKGLFFTDALIKALWQTHELDAAFQQVAQKGVRKVRVGKKESLKELNLQTRPRFKFITNKYIQKKFIIKPQYQALPTAAPENSADGWIGGRPSRVLIINTTGNRKYDGAAYARSTARLIQLMKKKFKADVTVITDPTEQEIEKAIRKLGSQAKPGKDEQAMVYITTHGGQHKEFYSGTSWAERNMAGLQFNQSSRWRTESGKQAFSYVREPELKNMVNQWLAPQYKHVNLVFDTCYAGSFTV